MRHRDAEWERVRERMYDICEKASEKNIGVLIDAEESWIQDPIDRLSIEMMEIFNRGMVAIVMKGNEFQGLVTRIDVLNWLRRRA